MQIQYYNMNSNQKCINKTCQCECKTYRTLSYMQKRLYLES